MPYKTNTFDELFDSYQYNSNQVLKNESVKDLRNSYNIY